MTELANLVDTNIIPANIEKDTHTYRYVLSSSGKDLQNIMGFKKIEVVTSESNQPLEDVTTAYDFSKIPYYYSKKNADQRWTEYGSFYHKWYDSKKEKYRMRPLLLSLNYQHPSTHRSRKMKE